MADLKKASLSYLIRCYTFTFIKKLGFIRPYFSLFSKQKLFSNFDKLKWPVNPWTEIERYKSWFIKKLFLKSIMKCYCRHYILHVFYTRDKMLSNNKSYLCKVFDKETILKLKGRINKCSSKNLAVSLLNK